MCKVADTPGWVELNSINKSGNLRGASL